MALCDEEYSLVLWKMAKQASQLIVAPGEAALMVAVAADVHWPVCDCCGASAFDLLVELGCRPKLAYASEPNASKTVVVHSISPSELQGLAHLDYEGLAKLNERMRAGAAAILLPRNEQQYSELYAKAVAIARTAVDRKQSLFARVEFFDSRSTN